MLRIIEEIRPRWAIIENVAALRARGLDEVLRGLAAIGYDAEWHCIPACAVGAPHRRDRVWIIGYPLADANRLPGDERRPGVASEGAGGGQSDRGGLGTDVADAHRQPSVQPALGDSEALGLSGKTRLGLGGCGKRQSIAEASSNVAGAHRPRLEIILAGNPCERAPAPGTNPWSVEPGVGRVAFGISARVDRLGCLGNAVVPQIPEVIGRAILAADRQ